MATHSSVLAWRIPWTEKPGRLQSMGSHRVRHDSSDLAAAAAEGVYVKYFPFQFLDSKKRLSSLQPPRDLSIIPPTHILKHLF